MKMYQDYHFNLGERGGSNVEVPGVQKRFTTPWGPTGGGQRFPKRFTRMLPKQGSLFNGERSKIKENGHKQKRAYLIEGGKGLEGLTNTKS